MEQTGKLIQFRYYELFVGEFRAVMIGNQVWINLGDFSRRSHLEKEVISRIAGTSRTVSIPNSDVADAESTDGMTEYIRFDSVFKLLHATEYQSHMAATLLQWISRGLLSPKCQLETGRFVHASTLHQLFGRHLDFSAWVTEVFSKNRGTLPRIEHSYNQEPIDDFKILLTEAREIVKREGGFAGKILRILIREGGFLHNGATTESMDDTLKRFLGLMQDRSGLVQARKVHEFINGSGPFEAWVRAEEQEPDYNHSASTIHDEFISQEEAHRRLRWNNGLSYPELHTGYKDLY